MNNILSKYTKEEIIEAIGYLSVDWQIDGRRLPKKIANCCEEKRTNVLFERSKELIDETHRKRQTYGEWVKRMAELYGHDGKVSISALPLEEVKIGAKLSKECKEVEDEYDTTQKQIDNAMREMEVDVGK